MFKSRLAKLEQTVKQTNDGEHKLYLVRELKEKNLMKIAGLDFFGTIENGQTLMDQHPNSLFVIMNIPDGTIDDNIFDTSAN